MMMNIARSVVLLAALLGSACGGDDDKCSENKAGGASCSEACECASDYCIPEQNVCSGADKPE